MKRTWQEAYLDKVISPETIEKTVSILKEQKKSIATLNGSFDLLHPGHLHIIYEAKKQADCLIVALNSNLSIQAYKDPKRPILPLSSRLQMLCALTFVDYVTWFDEVDPRALLEKIQPNVHVNGINYGEDCIEAATVKKYGGKIHLVSLIPSLSTTQIIDTILDKHHAFN